MPTDAGSGEQQSVLVGRDYEVTQLRAALDGARQRLTQLVEIVGEAGIGKTRLVAELPGLAPGFFFHSVTCELYRTGEAYVAVRSLLRTIAGIPAGADPVAAGSLLRASVTAVTPELLPVLSLLAAPCGAQIELQDTAVPSDPARRRGLMNNAVDALLSRTLTMPTVLVFEDAQWMDDASRTLIAHLLTHGVPKPWLVCVTRRPEGAPVAPDASRVVIALQALSRDAATELARSVARAAIHPSDLAKIVDRAAGNPFFLQELVSAGDGRLELPTSVESIVRTQLESLEPQDKLLLTRAAAIGRSFDLELLRSIVDDDSTTSELGARLGALDAFVAESLPDRFVFRHDLLQEAAYRLLSEDERPRIHARLASELERSDGPEDPSTLALHFGHAELWDQSWRYSLAAARAAQERYANEVAVEMYELAIRAAPRSDATQSEVADACESLADVLALSGRFDQAEERYRTLELHQARSAVQRARLLRKRAECRISRGEYKEGSDLLDRALGLLPPNADASERAEILTAAAVAAFRLGDYPRTVRLEDKVLAHVGERTQEHLRLRARAYMIRESAQDYLNGPRAVEDRLRALAIYEELGDVDGRALVLNNLGVHAQFDGRWSEALRFYHRATRLSREIGNIHHAAISINNEGEILSDQGRLSEARACLEEAQALFSATGATDGVSVAKRNLGRIAAREGRISEAEMALVEAIDELSAIGASTLAAVGQAYLAEAHVFAGHHRAARTVAEDAFATAQAGTTPGTTALLERVLGYAAFQNFEPDVAAEHFRRSIDAAIRDGAAYDHGLGLLAESSLAERTSIDDPEPPRHEAQQILERLGVLTVPAVPLPDDFFEREHRL